MPFVIFEPTYPTLGELWLQWIINMSIFVTLAQETQWEVHTQVSSSLEHLGGCDPSLCSSVLVLFMTVLLVCS